MFPSNFSYFLFDVFQKKEEANKECDFFLDYVMNI